MSKRSAWETVRLQGEEVIDEVRRIIHEGNVRRVVVKQKGQVVAEFPLTVGVVASVAAPILAAIGALVALLTECTIDLERRRSPSPRAPASESKRRKAASRKKPGARKTAAKTTKARQ
jgi:hypothetical protein